MIFVSATHKIFIDSKTLIGFDLCERQINFMSQLILGARVATWPPSVPLLVLFLLHFLARPTAVPQTGTEIGGNTSASILSVVRATTSFTMLVYSKTGDMHLSYDHKPVDEIVTDRMTRYRRYMQ